MEPKAHITQPDQPYGNRLMFTQSWEDPACDLDWLALAGGETLFAVTSGADNVLEFLLSDPARIISIDINPLQTHLAELKMAAFRRLSHGEMLGLLGVRRDMDLVEMYARLRPDLSEAAARYWDGTIQLLRKGLLTQGGFERYFAILRSVLRLLVGKRQIARLFELEPTQQPAFFDEDWNTRRWRGFLRIVGSRWFLGNRLDPSWFEHADNISSWGDHFGELARHAISSLPARTNYFLAQILLGHYLTEEAVPRYLKSEHFDSIRERLDRIELVTADVGVALSELEDDSVDAFALSNVFEYSPPRLFSECTDQVARVARPEARLTHRNLLAQRRFADDQRFSVEPSAGERLRRWDRGFIYSHFEACTYTGDGDTSGAIAAPSTGTADVPE